MNDQPFLPFNLTQARPKARESAVVYAAIVTLRKRGMSVYRMGARHTINGSIADRRQVLALARRP